MHNPALLILDEPTNGLDPIGIAEVRGSLYGNCAGDRKTILISSHILSEIALLADDIGIIDQGSCWRKKAWKSWSKRMGNIFTSRYQIPGRRPHFMHTTRRTETWNTDRLWADRAREWTGCRKGGQGAGPGGLTVSDAHLCEDTLEDYLKRITGVRALLKLIFVNLQSWSETSDMDRRIPFSLIPFAYALLLSDASTSAQAVEGIVLFIPDERLPLADAVDRGSGFQFVLWGSRTMIRWKICWQSLSADRGWQKNAGSLIFPYCSWLWADCFMVILLCRGWKLTGFWQLFLWGSVKALWCGQALPASCW